MKRTKGRTSVDGFSLVFWSSRCRRVLGHTAEQVVSEGCYMHFDDEEGANVFCGYFYSVVYLQWVVWGRKYGFQKFLIMIEVRG